MVINSDESFSGAATKHRVKRVIENECLLSARRRFGSTFNFVSLDWVSSNAFLTARKTPSREKIIIPVGSTKRLSFDKRRELCNLMMMRKKPSFD